jgi:hypothetical protein
MTTVRFVCVSFLKYRWDFLSGPSKKSSQHSLNIYLFLKSTVLIERGAFYEKKISYYSTYKLSIIKKQKLKYHTIGIVHNLIEKYHTVEIVHNLIDKYHTVGIVPKSNRKIAGRDLSDTFKAQNTNT